MRETEVESHSGLAALAVILTMLVTAAGLFLMAVSAHNGAMSFASIVLAGTAAAALTGLYMVEPNQAAVLSLFGEYVGTAKDQGLRWSNIFYAKRKVSLRTRNFESGRLKVNDLDGSPIEIGSVVVWAVVDSAEAVYNVDDYESFVHIQSESALRAMATSYPYDQHEDGKISLRSHAGEIAKHLTEEIQDRLAQAGVRVIEARISHLAYAPEIAQAMLQRQQAGAIIAARTRIVEGAVSMVEMALNELSKRNVVELDPASRSTLVGNLLVVLCSERGTQPTINTGQP